MILRLGLLAAGASAAVASLTIERPERFGITMPAALALMILAAGSVAAESVPLRRIPLACSVLTLALAPVMFARNESHAPIALAITLLQIIALVATTRSP